MRIKEFFIKRYGPLRDKSYTPSHSFTLFFGKNEDGKTLTIDALVKLLLGRDARDFTLIDRVEESPEGYVIVEDDKGREVKLTEKGTLAKVADLTSSEYRNIFVIRNSDLSIPRESEFYTNVTDRLIGLRTEEISKIQDILRQMGKITPTGSFRDIKGEKLKTRVEDAENLLGQIGDLAEEIKEGRYDELEEGVARHRDGLDRVTQMIENLEEARKREQYEKGKKACSGLKESLRKLEGMKIYNTDNEQIWRDCCRDIQRLDGDKRDLEKEIEREKAELKTISRAFSEKEGDLRILRETKNKIDNQIKQQVIDYETKSEKLALRNRRSRILTLTWKACTIVFVICLFGIIVRPSLLFSVLAALFLVSALVLWIITYQFVRYEASLAGAFERIKFGLSNFGLGAESIEGILANVQQFDVEFRKKEDELQNVERKMENIEARIREFLEKKIPDIDMKIRDAEERIDEIKVESKEGSLEEYTEKLLLKQKLERLAGEYESVLRSHFGETHGRLEQDILEWEKEVDALEKYAEKAKDTKYSEDAMSKLESERQQGEENLRETSSKLGSFQKKMTEVERKVNEILRSEDEYLYCKTSVDLEAVKNRLEAFLDENERNRDNALGVIRVFQEIESEERERVCELFETGSPVSQYFSDITGGFYEEVTLNQGTGQIEVKREDGVILGAAKLSGGAYDQLYLSIRLALGEKLLEGRTGFFIMDDPFIKADPDRLKRQVEMLKTISEVGWQIMYFSAKEEIKNVLKEDVERGVINRVEIQSILS